MSSIDDVPLICDPVPGPLLSSCVLVSDRMLSEREIEALRREWMGRFMIKPRDVQLVAIFEPRQWPDAEFCAA